MPLAGLQPKKHLEDEQPSAYCLIPLPRYIFIPHPTPGSGISCSAESGEILRFYAFQALRVNRVPWSFSLFSGRLRRSSGRFG
jgi:hypothetical protein